MIQWPYVKGKVLYSNEQRNPNYWMDSYLTFGVQTYFFFMEDDWLVIFSYTNIGYCCLGYCVRHKREQTGCILHLLFGIGYVVKLHVTQIGAMQRWGSLCYCCCVPKRGKMWILMFSIVFDTPTTQRTSTVLVSDAYEAHIIAAAVIDSMPT